jgi:hypothetical protein
MSFALIALPLSQLAPSSGGNGPVPQAVAPDNELTPEMIEAGFDVLSKFDSEKTVRSASSR